MQLHIEGIYKNIDKDPDRTDKLNFSIEIDATNNMIVPNNVSGPISGFNFVRLPNRMDLHKEVLDS